jgi:hypothetical protein
MLAFVTVIIRKITIKRSSKILININALWLFYSCNLMYHLVTFNYRMLLYHIRYIYNVKDNKISLKYKNHFAR